MPSNDDNRIVGGTVSFMERRRLADYEHREGRAELTFTCPDGDETFMFNRATELAVNQVRRMLLDAVVRSTVGRPPGARNRVKDDPRKDPGNVTETGPLPNAPIPEPTLEQAIEAVATEPVEVNPEAIPLSPTVAARAPTPPVPAIPAVSDAALQEACAKRNQALLEAGPTPTGQPAPGQRIRALAVEVAGRPLVTIRDMPAEVRAEFLTKLAALT